MKTITVPADIALVHPATKAPLVEGGAPVVRSFAAYAVECWLNDRRVGTSPVALHRWLKVVTAFDGVKPGDVVTLDDQDYSLLRTIVEDPAPLYAPLIAMQLLPFSEAVLGS